MFFLYLFILALTDISLCVRPKVIWPPVHPQRVLTRSENEKVQSQCGLVQSIKEKNFYILQGINMTEKEMKREAPWVVSINYETVNPDDMQAILCSGVLISPRHVLTAAHCMVYNEAETECANEGYRHKVKFNKREVARYTIKTDSICGHKDCTKEGRAYRVNKVIFPASYTNGRGPGLAFCEGYEDDTEDIAIFELTEDVKGAQFPCVADKIRSLMIKTMTNYGYGLTKEDEERHYLKKHTIEFTECDQWTSSDGPLPNNQLCVHYKEPNASLACSGDSGGPVVAKLNNRIYSVAILSSGDSCETRVVVARRNNGYFDTQGDLITSVSHYMDWICKWTGVCPRRANPTRDQRPTTVWSRYDGHRDTA